MKSQTIFLYCPFYFLFEHTSSSNETQTKKPRKYFTYMAKLCCLFQGINICRDQVLAISVFCENLFLRLLQFLTKSARICLGKISVFLHYAKINPWKILHALKTAGRYVPYTRPVWHFVKELFKYTRSLYV